MKQQPPVKGMVAAENLYCFNKGNETVSKVAIPTDLNNIIGAPSLGEPYREAHRMAMLLDSMASGMDCYIIVFNALKRKYGSDFVSEFYKEVQR